MTEQLRRAEAFEALDALCWASPIARLQNFQAEMATLGVRCTRPR